jgi:beta-glucosidase-like glycosyl hydrolase/CubicO group peptidase (beta-lactamase class C family)
VKRLLFLLLAVLLCSAKIETDGLNRPQPNENKLKESYFGKMIHADGKAAAWADSVMQTLDLRGRIGQLFIYKVAPERTPANSQLIKRVVQDYKIGGLLFSGGVLQNQAILTNEAQQLADIPLIITLDGEWGLAMRLKPSPLFPKNRILGNITNDTLLYEYGREVARESRQMGITVNFAPVADVDINPNNPVINVRSFGEDPHRVAKQVIAYSKGLQDGGVVAVAKHFPGHGDTDVDSHQALPVLNFTRERLDSIELVPFREAFDAGIDGVMVGHLDIPALTERKGLASSLSHNIVNDLLEKELGFSGLKFTDALEMKGAINGGSASLQALMAGNDMLLVPSQIKPEMDAILNAVAKGQLKEGDINLHCKKVLMYKYVLGLTKKPFIQISGLEQRINTVEANDFANRLAQAAVVMTGNTRPSLPIDIGEGPVVVLNVGNNASAIKPFVDELSKHVKVQVLGLSAETSANTRQQLISKLNGFKRVIVTVTSRELNAYQTFFNEYKPTNAVVSAFFIAQKDLTRLPQAVQAADAVVIAHDKAEAIQVHVARAMAGMAPITGRLSTSIGGLMKAGEGTDLVPELDPVFSPEDFGFDSKKLHAIDTLAQWGIREQAFPGCQVVVMKDGHFVYNKVFGNHTYKDTGREGEAVLPVRQTDVYDLASMTKTTATLLAVMKLYDQGKISLTERVATYLPYLKGTDKQTITMRSLLYHESGLPASISFYREAIDKDSYEGSILSNKRDKLHTIQIAARDWINPDYQYIDSFVSDHQSADYPLQVAEGVWLSPSFKEVYHTKIVDATLRSRTYRYSDVNFILLQQVVEQLTGISLDEYVDREFYQPMGLKRTGFRPLQHIAKDQIVPTSQDKFLRKQLLQGYVHDEAAAFQGGVSGNAGLFSNATEVAKVYQMLMNGGEFNGRRYLSESTCKLFTTSKSRISRRGLGFDKPDVANKSKSPCPDDAPATVYGHTGFTGTCVWVDPTNHFIYVFLSNRVHPDSWNPKLGSMNIRPKMMQAIYDAMKK